MRILVVVAVTLLGAAAGQQYDPYRGQQQQLAGPPLYRGPAQFAGSAGPGRFFGPSVSPQHAGGAQFSGSAVHGGQGSKKGPVGGPAPPDAVQKATEEFNRLYKEAAALAAAAPDDPVSYDQPQQGAFQQPQQQHVQQDAFQQPQQQHVQQDAFQQPQQQHVQQGAFHHPQQQHVQQLPRFPAARPSFPGVRSQFSAGPPPTLHAGSRGAFGGPASGHVTAPGHVTGPPQQVQDTPEVAAAKAKFFKEFQRRAQEAAAAPDDPHQGRQPLQQHQLNQQPLPAFYRPDRGF